MTNALIALALLAVSCPSVRAASFPYTSRTRDYSGWTAATQADTNTTGMAGATVALPSSISAAEANPAGFAMATSSVSAQINHISVNDRRIQPQSIDSSQWGLGVSPPPWGFSISYYSPTTENDRYFSPNTANTVLSEASLKELRLTVARSFLDSQLAVGISPELVKAVREIGPTGYGSVAPSYRLGALYRLPRHWILGASYSPPLTIGPSSTDAVQSDMPGFNRAMLRPSQLSFGAGWVPNRFFKTGIQLSYVGNTANTALLSDQSVTTGETASVVPRIGASYVLAEFNNFKGELATGSYYEPSRLSGRGSRLHGTIGLEANPWFVNLGVGFDLSKDYHNVMLGIGVDVVRTLRTFDIIPKEPTPASNRFFPRPDAIIADGLPEAMTHGEPRQSSETSVGQVTEIVKEAPGNLVDKVQGKPTTVEIREGRQNQKRKRKQPPKGRRARPPKSENNSGTINLAP